MNNILTIVAVLLIIGWLVGYIGFGEAVGSLIHILLVLAVVSFLIRVIAGRR
ncbi:MAG: lmo0937 family membrane protein [Chitinophagales bacterium]